MSLRASSSVEIAVGPFSVFVKLYSVATEKGVTFSTVHAACGAKVEQQYVCADEKVVVPRVALAKQYRTSSGALVMFTDDDLKELENERSGAPLEILEFLPPGSVDAIYFGKASFVGPDQDRGIDAYSTFVDALKTTNSVALGRHTMRSRDQLVLIEPYADRGLLMRELFYGRELRALSEVELPLGGEYTSDALRLWTEVVAKGRRDEFDAAKYRDGYAERVEDVAAFKLRTTATARGAPTRLVHAARRRSIGRPPSTAPNGPSDMESLDQGLAPASARPPPAKAVARTEPASENVKSRRS